MHLLIIRGRKKHPKHHHHHHHSRKEGNDKKHQHIPLNQDDFQPLSAEVSSEDDDADFRSKERYGSDSTTESETRGVQKYQIADLEEVPHGIVRQARTLKTTNSLTQIIEKITGSK